MALQILLIDGPGMWPKLAARPPLPALQDSGYEGGLSCESVSPSLYLSGRGSALYSTLLAMQPQEHSCHWHWVRIKIKESENRGCCVGSQDWNSWCGAVGQD